MADDHSGDFVERRKYRRYKLELICSDPGVRDDLEYLRIAEEGARISIMPTGEVDISRSVKFIVQHKAFHEINYDDDSIAPTAYRTVQALIDLMLGASARPSSSVAPAAARVAPVIHGTPGDMVSQMGFQTTGGSHAAEYRLTPVAKRLGSGPVPAAASPLPKPAGFVIPDKYKIKRSDVPVDEK